MFLFPGSYDNQVNFYVVFFSKINLIKKLSEKIFSSTKHYWRFVNQIHRFY